MTRNQGENVCMIDSDDDIFFGIMTIDEVLAEEREERALAIMKSLLDYFAEHEKKKEEDNSDVE